MNKSWFHLHSILQEHTITKTIDIGEAARFKGDFNGLLLRVFSIPEKHLLPTLMVNGLTSSSAYDGSNVEIKLIDSDILSKYSN